MIFYPQPISHVFTLSINGQWLFVFNVMDHQWNELFWKLMASIIIRTVADYHWKTIGFGICSNEMVRACFTRTVRGIWIIWCAFGELTFISERTVHLIRAYMVKPTVFRISKTLKSIQ